MLIISADSLSTLVRPLTITKSTYVYWNGCFERQDRFRDFKYVVAVDYNSIPMLAGKTSSIALPENWRKSSVAIRPFRISRSPCAIGFSN